MATLVDVGAPRHPGFRRVRGLLVGATAGFGAMAAHQAGGGQLHVVPSLVAIAVSLGLGLALVRERRIGVRRAVLGALLAQELWHAVFVLATTPTDAAADHAGAAHTHAAGEAGISAMLVLHVLVSAATAALTVGADRAIVAVLRAIADRLRARVPRPITPLVASALPVWTTLTDPATDAQLRGIAARAPPPALRLPLTPTPGA